MMSYPLEKDKGKAFGIFWAIFQLGSFIGAVIALAINIHSGSLDAVSTATYIAFIIIAFLGIFSGVCVTYPFYCIYAKWYLEPLYEPDEHGNIRVTPEARLPPALIGCWAIPICLVCF